MKRKNRKSLLVTLSAALLIAMLSVTGCGNGSKAGNGADAGESAKPADTTPVTMKVFVDVPFSDDDWSTLIEAPLKSKFPYITLERTQTAKGAALPDLIPSGYSPDLILSGFYFIANLQQLGLTYDISDMIKKQKLDLSKLDQNAVQAMQGFADGKLIGLPLYMNTTMLFYNKDIFNKFGVSYPKDGMSWDQAAEIARNLTRTDGGVKYFGLAPGSWDTLGSQLSIQKIDTKTNKSLINSGGYNKVFELLQKVNSIPGMDASLNGGNAFVKDKTLAMYSFWLTDTLITLETAEKGGSPINWDMVTTPNFADKPGVGSKVDAHVLMISAQSKLKAQAFDVIQYLTSSVEAQTGLAKAGKIPLLKNPEIQKQYGENYATMKGKNLDAVFKSKMAPMPPYSVLEGTVKTPLNNALKAVNGGTDINTALRQADDEANKAIELQLVK